MSVKPVGINGLAQELRLPREWLIAQAEAGRIPCLRVGRRRLFNVDAVRWALAQQAATGDALRRSTR